MSDESQLQVTRKAGDSPLSIATARSGLIARGRKDAERIILREPTFLSSKARQLADEGDADAQFELGQAYDGWGGPRNHLEAETWYRKAADQGHAEAQVALGWMYYASGEPHELAEAACLWRKAADNGHAGAQRSLGTCYRDGEGVRQDQTEAVLWFRKSAEQGDGDAQYWLGIFYRDGEGVTQDYIMALMLFNLSASNGSALIYQESRARKRDELASEMTPGQIAEAQRLAREWKPKPGVESKSG